MGRVQTKLLSVFTGLGGLDLGLEAAGFAQVGYLEIDGRARESLARNRPAWQPLSPHDVTGAAKSLTPESFGFERGELGILAGGPPCQPFSKAAQWSHRAMRGLRDPRARCLSGMMGLMRLFLPRVLVIENVEGFVRGQVSALPTISRHLRQINRQSGTKYELQFALVDTADYGVPQRRRRAILFAERSGQRLSLPEPTHRERPVTAWEALGELDGAAEPLPPLRHWTELLPSIPEGQNYLWHTPRGGGLPLFGYRTRFWSFLLKLSRDRPAWTLPAQPGPYTGPFHWDNRPLTVPEQLRLQSFPATWYVAGPRREQVRQIGNATPPLLAEIIGRAIQTQVFGLKFREPPTLSIAPSKEPCPNIPQLLEVPSRFRSMARNWPSHPGTGMGPRPTLKVSATNGKSNLKKSARPTGTTKSRSKSPATAHHG